MRGSICVYMLDGERSYASHKSRQLCANMHTYVDGAWMRRPHTHAYRWRYASIWERKESELL